MPGMHHQMQIGDRLRIGEVLITLIYEGRGHTKVAVEAPRHVLIVREPAQPKPHPLSRPGSDCPPG